MKAVEFRIWARSFVKHKGNYEKLSKIRDNIRIMRKVRLNENFLAPGPAGLGPAGHQKNKD
jgi:hypothetical protein